MFFFFVGGLSPQLRVLRHLAERCGSCGERGSLRLLRSDSVLRLFFVPVWSFKGAEFMACEACGWSSAPGAEAPAPLREGQGQGQGRLREPPAPRLGPGPGPRLGCTAPPSAAGQGAVCHGCGRAVAADFAFCPSCGRGLRG
ncbi:hypothetical protein HYH03_018921 [Edaphochlamys debaryana]|uniref:Zinc-ribbon 15 domain-containing protein n=1 Tax=Edaphochlamys debaryana TaxID=47281 RepID=A0A835XJ95_9CHLO|nr:hypothetical protein HYH03_018921 [Edaphochlamys debaryana]|eukprot:KAG2482135.1 hypothetical protein HYH03_018921 [Edaphochlamys debaryana]